MLTTTFEKLHQAEACFDRYRHLAKALGGVSRYGKATPIPLLTILEHNGLEDVLWALRATIEDSDRISRLLAADFAEHVIPFFEAVHRTDQRPRKAIEISRQYAFGLCTTEELNMARDAAAAAAAAAAEVAAYATAYAACAAARAAAYGAAGVVDYNTECAWQEARLRQYLMGEVELTSEAFGL